MVNGWTPYQAETCVTWSRFASFVEVGGRTGLGFRDTAQDAMSVPHSNPQRVRQRIVELLHAQASAGFALHLFDPSQLLPKSDDTGPDATIPTIGTADERPDQVRIPPRTDVCSDDALWLIGAVCDDLQETGATEFLETVIPFADGGEASVYTHLKRALDFSAAQRGPHGLCLGLRADWNDCINLRGGESAFVSFLFHWALRRFVDLARSVGRDDDVAAYGKLADQVRIACAAHLWDGRWYLRGFTAAGRKIGTQEDQEGRLFLTAQTWAVMSGVSRGDRATACMDAVDEHLFSRFGLHLLWPAYSQGDDDIGFVTRVTKGIKENAAIFSHPNPWAVIAECMLGRGDRAMKFYRAMLPCEQNDMIEIRQAEPYSYCQFVIGRDHPLHGQARHPWLTGSAAWFYIAATRWILGVRPGHDGLTIDPCIPPTWQEFSIRRQWRGGTYAIDVRNPKGVASGVAAIELDGRPVTGPLPPPQPGAVHKVSVVMG
jgi:N,N'-diacetylchitobiose phosphorylase